MGLASHALCYTKENPELRILPAACARLTIVTFSLLGSLYTIRYIAQKREMTFLTLLHIIHEAVSDAHGSRLGCSTQMVVSHRFLLGTVFVLFS